MSQNYVDWGIIFINVQILVRKTRLYMFSNYYYYYHYYYYYYYYFYYYYTFVYISMLFQHENLICGNML